MWQVSVSTAFGISGLVKWRAKDWTVLIRFTVWSRLSAQ